MKRKILIAVISCMLSGQLMMAQNNPIFFGGKGDGYHRREYAQARTDTALFHGGKGDGAGKGAYVQAVASHTAGGKGDGYAAGTYTQTVASLAIGGKGDGYGSVATAKPDADRIFYGGRGDGWNMAATPAPAADRIFFGGRGDGWSSDYLPVSPLPLTLLSFSGREAGPANILEWRTASEVNTAYFVLERSATTHDFVALGTVAASGNTRGEKAYSFTDEQPFAEQSFYRLRMVDADGRFVYSNTVLLKRLNDLSVLKIYPNPAASVLNIELTGRNSSDKVQVTVYDAAGRLLQQKDIRKEDHVFQLGLQGLAAGVYTLRIADGDHVSTVRFVKS